MTWSARCQELGFDKLLERAVAAVEKLLHTLVYAGFSNGGACAELLAATRPGARGAILMHAPLMVRDLGWKVWPSNVHTQVHFADKDPIRNQAGGPRFESVIAHHSNQQVTHNIRSRGRNAEVAEVAGS